ncbi:UNC-like C-terminal-domain-containing protein [Trametes maxima]|nr:UNC-like C-terminal-domain-containing protein [Trametes maxima]
MFSTLPTSLLALLFASPVLSGPTTPNDLFHDIAVYAPRRPEEPVCCLRPLPPLEPPPEDDLLLSFEDWKAKRFSEATERESVTPPAQKVTENASQVVVPDTPPNSSDVQNTPSDVHESSAIQERVAPHFRIPIHDRFNYASLDCSARVHSAHKSAKSPSSILSHKKDRYMLSPCAEKKQFVIVELCEDIRIDTVQLANYEFFSGVFKDFTVSVSKTFYPDDPDTWTFAGTFRAKNARGVQSFHPPSTLRDFYRYIRIDFHSHYGNEYYCPVSLLRVYGLTHLEEWQWETWDAESRAKRSVEEASPPLAMIAEPPQPVHASTSEPEQAEDGRPLPVSNVGPPSPKETSDSVSADTPDGPSFAHENPSPTVYSPETIPKTADGLSTAHFESHTGTLATTPKTHSYSTLNDPSRPITDSVYNTTSTAVAHSPSIIISTSSSIASSSSSSSILSYIVSTVSDSHSSIFIDHHPDSGPSTASSYSPSPASSVRSPAASPNVSSLSVISSSHSHHPHPVPPASTGGESIYRLIMNRLTALEANTTLYARYVEEQTAGMREVLRRLGEDIGRLESIGKAQAQLYQRSVVELEKQTRRLESEHRDLVSRVNNLTDEVVLEKRLGIAQLCLLLTVLVFMALTRGSRGEVVYPARRSVREWGRRTLSLSGGWVDRLRARSATPPRQTTQNPGENDIAFPSLDTQVVDQLSHSSRRGASTRKQIPRPHTPTSIRSPTARHFAHHRAVPPSPSLLLPRPGIQRSSSGSMTHGFGGIGPVPKSAKRWARSAHLHEVKGATTSSPSNGLRHRKSGEATPVASRNNTVSVDVQDVFSSPSRAQVLLAPAFDGTGTISKGKARAMDNQARHPSPLRGTPIIDISSRPPSSRGRDFRSHPSQAESELSEGEAWVDTDVDGSECDLVVDASVDVGTRERTYVGAAANSSL